MRIDRHVLTDNLLNLDTIICAQNVVILTWTVISPRGEVGEIVAADLRSRLSILDERGILRTKVNRSRRQPLPSLIHCRDLSI